MMLQYEIFCLRQRTLPLELPRERHKRSPGRESMELNLEHIQK